MTEDLSAYIERDPDGRPRLRPGVKSLPPMRSASPPAKRQTTTAGTSTDRDDRKADEPKRKNTGDRFAVLNAFIDVTLAGLTRSEIAVWLILYRDTRDGTVRTSQENIAKRSGTSVRHVKRAVASLTAAGLLTEVFRGGLNRGPSRYRVNSLGTRRS